MEAKCKDCKYGKDVKYRQVHCQKRNVFLPETHTCEWQKPKENNGRN